MMRVLYDEPDKDAEARENWRRLRAMLALRLWLMRHHDAWKAGDYAAYHRTLGEAVLLPDEVRVVVWGE